MNIEFFADMDIDTSKFDFGYFTEEEAEEELRKIVSDGRDLVGSNVMPFAVGKKVTISRNARGNENTKKIINRILASLDRIKKFSVSIVKNPKAPPQTVFNDNDFENVTYKTILSGGNVYIRNIYYNPLANMAVRTEYNPFVFSYEDKSNRDQVIFKAADKITFFL